MRLWLETALARGIGAASRRSGRGGGTTLPGKVLLRIDANAPARLARRLGSGSVLVSATNGKTTTTAMAAAILGDRFRIVHNRAGANLVSGVATALVEARNADLGLFEVDEAALSELSRLLAPDAILLGNLFRDQLDRYGELEHLVERWRALALDHRGLLLVNADDPVLADIARDHRRALRFGLDDPAVGHARVAHAADSKYCLRCGAALAYGPAYVGHLGAWSCLACGDRRPPLDVSAGEITLRGLEGSSFTLVAGGRRARIELGLPGVYNVYNAVAAAALAGTLGAGLEQIASALAAFRPAFGRLERLPVDGRTLLQLLIKNPAGANEVVRTLAAAGPRGAVVVMLNDAIADGRDVSWIWDVDFEPLLEVAGTLIVGGSRAEELGLRFAYAGVAAERIVVEHDPWAAVERGLESTPCGDELAVLPTYTAMLELQACLVDRGISRPFWEARR